MDDDEVDLLLLGQMQELLVWLAMKGDLSQPDILHTRQEERLAGELKTRSGPVLLRLDKLGTSPLVQRAPGHEALSSPLEIHTRCHVDDVRQQNSVGPVEGRQRHRPAEEELSLGTFERDQHFHGLG